MNGKQAIIRLKVKINQLDTSSNRTVRPEQALLFLNDAYKKLAKAKYRLNTNKDDRSGFQLNQVTTDELNHLTTKKELVPDKEGNEYNVSINDIDNYWIHLRSELEVKVGNKTKLVKNPNYRSLDTLGPADNDPFNSSIPTAPIVFFEDNKIKVLGNDFEILKHNVIYYRFPDVITLEEEIKAPFVDEIIDFAAVAMLENWGDQRSQSKVGIDKVVENE